MATLYLVGGGVDWFSNGSISLFQYLTIRPLVFNPIIEGYRDTIEQWDHDLREFDFRAGRIGVYVAQPRNVTLTYSVNMQFAAGRISVRGGGPPAIGALGEFAYYPAAAIADPLDFYIQSATALASGSVADPMVRHNAVFAPGKLARYLAVGAKYLAVPALGSTGQNQSIKRVQLETAHIGGSYPTASTYAREVRTRIRPDRVNMSVNPDFWVNTTNWTGVTRGALAQSVYSGFAGQVIMLANGTATVTHLVSKLQANKTYLVRLKVMATAPVSILQSVSSPAAASHIQNKVAQPLVDYLSFYLSTGSTPNTDYTISYALTAGATPSTVSLFEMQIEPGTVPNDYFDGSFGGDYMWETGGTVGTSRSYFYLNRSERYAALVRNLQENVPLGIGIALPEFAKLPYNTR